MSGLRVGDLEVNHTVHPDIKKYHKSYSTSPKDLRERKAQRKQACAVCGISEYELRLCAKVSTMIPFFTIVRFSLNK
jgi:hypothetical protein